MIKGAVMIQRRNTRMFLKVFHEVVAACPFIVTAIGTLSRVRQWSLIEVFVGSTAHGTSYEQVSLEIGMFAR